MTAQTTKNTVRSFRNYLVSGREKYEVGKTKQVIINPARGTRDTFEKLKSNAIGDQFVDPGQYFLRKTDRAQSSGVFRQSGCNKKVRKSEFEHLHNGPPQRPDPERRKNFMTRSTYELFQKQVKYTEDLYENKEDLKRQDYVMRRSQILNLQRPYTSTVRQRGTFYAEKTTYGTDREFPNVSNPLIKEIQKNKPQKQPPLFGPFKRPNPPHVGYNKTIGQN